MIIKNTPSWAEKENAVTDEATYLNRRHFIKKGLIGGVAAGVSSAALSNIAAGGIFAKEQGIEPLTYKKDPSTLASQLTPFDAVTGYNNFYEFGTGKSDPAEYAHTMKTDPWSVKVTGMAEKTGTFALEDLVDFNALEERIYRLRCVEAWSMVIPWIGVPLSSILKKLEPKSGAKYVAFETLADRRQMRGVRWRVLDWPYKEGLRMDEAMHPLTMMAVGLYGKTLPNQNGAPLRLVVPWKYGFKSIKSIVRIHFTSRQPKTSWEQSAPREYGFYSNVNPLVNHPRWSQARERRIGEFGRRDTEMFNGYGAAVADLYKDMDLRKYY